MAKTSFTSGRAAISAVIVGLNPKGSGPRLSPCTHQSDITSSSRISLTVALSDSEITDTVATRAKPIISADAAVAVLSGLRPAFLRAILLGTPSFAVGKPRKYVTLPANNGLSRLIPRKELSAAAPRSAISIEVERSAVRAVISKAIPRERNDSFPMILLNLLSPRKRKIPATTPSGSIMSHSSIINPRTIASRPSIVSIEPARKFFGMVYAVAKPLRSAAIGEIERARKAGQTAAVNVSPIPRIAPIMTVIGLRGSEFSSGPKFKAARSSCSPNAIGNPSAIPVIVAKMPTNRASVTIEFVICFPVAPSARSKPIS